MKIFRALLLFLFINSFFTIAQNNPLVQDYKKIANTKNYQSFTFNGIWSWFSDPRAVYYEGNYKRTYAGWIDNYGDIHIAYYDHSKKTIKSIVVSDNLEIDDHNNPSILIDENGYLFVFFNTHLQDKNPLYMLKSNFPENIDNWSLVRELYLNDENLYKKAENLNHTYTNPIKLSAEDGKIFLFWRGVDLRPTYATSQDNGDTWSTGKILFIPDEEFSFRVPYTKIYSDGISKIHFTFTDGHPTKETSNALYYMYYEAGAFFKADGSKIKTIEQLPIEQQDLDLVYEQTSDNNKVWNWDIAQNENGDPIIVYVKFPDINNHIYCYAIWKDNKWLNYELINSGNWFPNTPKDNQESEPNYSGGICIDHESPNTLYLSVKRQDFFEIEKWITNDEGKTWDIKKITENSSKNNIRPFAIRNAKKENNLQLLWIQNTKYINYSLSSIDKNSVLNFNDRYQTAIKMDIEYPEKVEMMTKESIVQASRELIDWQLENPSSHIKNTNYKYGIFYDGINAFYSITNEERYKNELFNVLQYEGEEESEMLSIENLIWYFNLNSNRLYTNKLNTLTPKDISKIKNDIRTVSLAKLLTLINEDDNIEKKKLNKLYLKYLEGLLNAEINYKDYDKTYTNMLSIYCIAKGINDGIVPLNQKQKVIKSWLLSINIIITKEYKNQQWDSGITGSILLASKEIYDLLE